MQIWPSPPAQWHIYIQSKIPPSWAFKIYLDLWPPFWFIQLLPSSLFSAYTHTFVLQKHRTSFPNVLFLLPGKWYYYFYPRTCLKNPMTYHQNPVWNHILYDRVSQTSLYIWFQDFCSVGDDEAAESAFLISWKAVAADSRTTLWVARL
jgi:hypothetical protein